MRRILSVIALSMIAVLSSSLSPVSADHGVDGGHWGKYKWAGQTSNIRAFYVFDTQTDPTVTAAMQEVIAAFNSDANRRGVMGLVPYLAYADNRANNGHCGALTGLAGYSLITVCSPTPPAASGCHPGPIPASASITCGAGGHYGEPVHPWMFIQRAYPDYNTTFSHLVHEILHAMGLAWNGPCNAGHSCDSGSAVFYRISPGEKKWLNEHDWAALIDLYVHRHPLHLDS